MEIIYFVLALIFLCISFYALARIVDVFFVESLEIISSRLKLSSDVAGATFMAAGSSAPELMVALLALFKVGEQQSIGAGTIVGSAIFNILVIIGASAIFKKAYLTWQPVVRDILFYSISIVMLLAFFYDGQIVLWEAVAFIVFYVIYVFSFKFWKIIFPYKIKGDNLEKLIESEREEIEEVISEPLSITNVFDKLLSYFFLDLKKRPNLYMFNFLSSLILLGLFTHLMIESALHIAHVLHIPEVIIGLTILAAGTSIPDLLSSINVAKKGKGDMAIANAVGSNIFDIAIGLGVPWFIYFMFIESELIVATENLSSSIILLFTSVLAVLFIFITQKWSIGKYGGIILILIYLAYLIFQSGILSFTLCLNIFDGYCLAI
jgi:K+-dependent Na+/Ca+ exchanger-like protein